LSSQSRGDNPAVAAAEASVESGVETKPKSVRNPKGEFRRELGVIIYNFDKKEQVKYCVLGPVLL